MFDSQTLACTAAPCLDHSCRTYRCLVVGLQGLLQALGLCAHDRHGDPGLRRDSKVLQTNVCPTSLRSMRTVFCEGSLCTKEIPFTSFTSLLSLHITFTPAKCMIVYYNDYTKCSTSFRSAVLLWSGKRLWRWAWQCESTFPEGSTFFGCLRNQIFSRLQCCKVLGSFGM